MPATARTKQSRRPPEEPAGPIEYRKGDKQVVAYNFIKDAIVTNAYKAQQQLSEAEIGAALGGLSRTPIRDALKRLAYEGFVENIPGKGVFVAQVSIKDLLEISELRMPLEEISSRLFVERAPPELVAALGRCLEEHRQCFGRQDYIRAIELDNEFHYIIAKGTMNNRLHQTVHQLIEESSRGAYLTQHDDDRVRASIEQHGEILEAIRSGNPKAAQQCMDKHLQDWIGYINKLQIQKYFLFNR